jgi:formylmethanofuran dehydrogenase subunit E
MKYVCQECGSVFNEPKQYIEKHGLDTPPYEIIEGCPDCGGAVTKTERCHICGEYITEKYIRTMNFDLICADCYIERDIREEGICD